MNIKLFLVVFLVTLSVTLVSAIIGNILEANGTIGNLGPRGIMTVKVFFLSLFCLLVFSLLPLILHFFLVSQARIGNADLFVIKWLQSHEKEVIYGVWLFFLVGLCIAVPVAIKGGFLSGKS